MMGYVLEVKNVDKYYGNKSNLTKAISGISFNVEYGEFVLPLIFHGLPRPGFPQRTLSPRPLSVLARGVTSAWGAKSARFHSLKSLPRN